MAIVYQLKSPSGKLYIGYTKGELKVRLKQHINSWKLLKKRGEIQYLNGCTKLFHAFDKYPPEDWEYTVLFESEKQNQALSKEKEFIELLNTIEDGYNISKGGDGGPREGYKTTDEARHNRSEARKRFFASPEGEAWKEELRTKGNYRIGNTLGKREWSEDARKRLSDRLKGVPHPNAQGKKLAPFSTEHCANISKAKKGIKPKPEHIIKRRETQLAQNRHQTVKQKQAARDANLKWYRMTMMDGIIFEGMGMKNPIFKGISIFTLSHLLETGKPSRKWGILKFEKIQKD